jgi:membrane peptidoglycan carboxypeptidase
VGLDNVVKMARRLGISTPLSAVPGLVLGQNEVTVLEISRAFGVIANGGVKNSPTAITKILDGGDCSNPRAIKTCRVIYDRADESRSHPQVLRSEVAEMMTNLLRGVVRSGTGTSAAVGLDEVGKTGTTNDGRDLWFIGYVPSRKLLTTVWLGNDDNAPTSGSSAQAAAVWGDYMRQVVR